MGPSEITRERILKTAARLFADRGYEATDGLEDRMVGSDLMSQPATAAAKMQTVAQG